MTTAIVTITCPSCGGRIDNVTSTDEEQTIKCKFCGTDLHIPRVGVERVVHEVIREVPSAPVIFDSDQVPSIAPQNSRKNVVIAFALGSMILAISLVLVNRSADDTIQKMDTCEADCKAECLHAGDKERPDQEDGPKVQASLQSADRTLCESQCHQTNKCFSSN